MDAATQFDQEGYCTPVDILTDDQVTAYRRAFDELQDRLGKDQTQITLTHKEWEYSFIWQLATEPALLKAVAAVYGPDLIMIGTHFFCKYPAAEMGREAYVAWHQDVTYWGLEPPQAMTAWIALDDADAENGALMVIPRSHRQGLRDHEVKGDTNNLLSASQELAVSAEEVATAVTMALRAGQASFHDGLAIHGSQPNRSTRRRCGLTVRFIRPDVFLDTEKTLAPWRPVLVHGEDRQQKTRLYSAPTF